MDVMDGLNESQRRVLSLLQKNPDGLPFMDIYRSLDYSKPTISAALRALQERGLVEKDGPLYRAKESLPQPELQPPPASTAQVSDLRAMVELVRAEVELAQNVLMKLLEVTQMLIRGSQSGSGEMSDARRTLNDLLSALPSASPARGGRSGKVGRKVRREESPSAGTEPSDNFVSQESESTTPIPETASTSTKSSESTKTNTTMTSEPSTISEATNPETEAKEPEPVYDLDEANEADTTVTPEEQVKAQEASSSEPDDPHPDWPLPWRKKVTWLGRESRKPRSPLPQTEEEVESLADKVLQYFVQRFEASQQLHYGTVSAKEREKAKALVRELPIEDIGDMIRWFFRNFRTHPMFANVTSAPNFHVFCGWKDAIRREVLSAEGQLRNRPGYRLLIKNGWTPEDIAANRSWPVEVFGRKVNISCYYLQPWAPGLKNGFYTEPTVVYYVHKDFSVEAHRFYPDKLTQEYLEYLRDQAMKKYERDKAEAERRRKEEEARLAEERARREAEWQKRMAEEAERKAREEAEKEAEFQRELAEAMKEPDEETRIWRIACVKNRFGKPFDTIEEDRLFWKNLPRLFEEMAKGLPTLEELEERARLEEEEKKRKQSSDNSGLD